MSTLIVTGLPRDLFALAAEIHQGNIDAGWWKQDSETGRTMNRNIGELLCLVHSEISEADDGWSRNLMDDKLPHRRMIEVELADVAIRVLDILGFYQFNFEGRRFMPIALPDHAFWPEWCRMMHRTTSQAMEGFRKGDKARGCVALDTLLGIVNFAALSFQLDLAGAIAEKRAFNASRADHKPESRAAEGGKAF